MNDEMEECKLLYEVEEWIRELVHHMYATGDVKEMENALDELTAVWGISLPKHEPLIEKKESSVPQILNLSTPEKFNEFENKWNKMLSQNNPNDPLYLEDVCS